MDFLDPRRIDSRFKSTGTREKAARCLGFFCFWPTHGTDKIRDERNTTNTERQYTKTITFVEKHQLLFELTPRKRDEVKCFIRGGGGGGKREQRNARGRGARRDLFSPRDGIRKARDRDPLSNPCGVFCRGHQHGGLRQGAGGDRQRSPRGLVHAASRSNSKESRFIHKRPRASRHVQARRDRWFSLSQHSSPFPPL